jgi:Dolichyl-phosphate-mannose-protein mannosyltransferase
MSTTPKATVSASKPSLKLAPPSSFTVEKVRPGTWILLGIALLVAWMLRGQDFHFSTAYMDESVYVIYGRMFLAHHFEAPLDTPLQWSFGWYLWPVMAAVADRIHGLMAVRFLASGLGLVSIAAVFGFARRMFSNTVAAGAAMVMAVLGPAVLVSRIATRDSGAICFFALGLWAFARGWRSNKKRDWFLSAVFFFAAFLCKYLVAIYFPALVIVALCKRKISPLIFVIPLSVSCALYAWFYWNDLLRLLSYGAAYRSLRAPTAQALQIYFWGRWDFWILVALALLPLFVRRWRGPAAMLWGGSLIALLFQWKTRADFDYWKHVNYALLFLVPLAVAGVVWIAGCITKNEFARTVTGGFGVIVLAGTVAWLGKAHNLDQFLFWQNVDPVLAYFENRLTPNDRVLVDDTVFRYYFSPPLHQYQITDPMYFHYGDSAGEEAYKAAIKDGAFNYVVIDGGIGDEAHRMDAAIRPLPEPYKLEFVALDPTLGQRIEIYAKPGEVHASETGPGIQLASPASNSLVNTTRGEAAVDGIATGAQPGWYIQTEVFTNKWWPQGGHIPIAPDGTFHQLVALGGEGMQQCHHLLRARLFDAAGTPRAFTLNYNIARSNADGSAPACRSVE